jgi:hypothetical protein
LKGFLGPVEECACHEQRTVGVQLPGPGQMRGQLGRAVACTSASGQKAVVMKITYYCRGAAASVAIGASEASTIDSV